MARLRQPILTPSHAFPQILFDSIVLPHLMITSSRRLPSCGGFAGELGSKCRAKAGGEVMLVAKLLEQAESLCAESGLNTSG